MPVHTITLEERNRITDQNAHLFIARHVNDYFPCTANSEKLCGFIESQLGMPIVDWPYPLQLEQYEVAFEHIKATGWFYQRPEPEAEPEDPAAVKERAAQERVRAEYDAQQAAAKMQRDRNMPLSELGKIVGVQNGQLRAVRESSGLPVRQPGTESRSLATVTFGLKATARANTAAAHPELAIDSQEWNKHYAVELQKLRG
jgi:hypothetical protein